MNGKTLLKTFTVAIIIAQLLVACAPAATPTTVAPAQPTSPPAAATQAPAQPATGGQLPEIVVACWSGPEHDNLVKVAAAYTAKTGNKVTVEEIAREFLSGQAKHHLRGWRVRL